MPVKPRSPPRSLVEGGVRQSLVRMTLPMIFGMLMLFTFSLVDTWFISFLGTEALTAISFTFPVTFTVMSLAIGLGIGASAVVARSLGASRPEQAKEAATVINYLSLGLAAALAGLLWLFMDPVFGAMGASDALMAPIRRYMTVWLPGSVMIVCIMTGNSVLRAAGDTRTPSMLMATAGALNAVLDPLLIFGLGPFPELGIQGAAWATVTAWGAVFCRLFHLLAFRLERVSRSLPSRAVFARAGPEMLRIGIPAAGANLMTPLAVGAMISIAAGFGDTAVAAFGVGARLEPIATLLVLALSSSLPPIISQNLGAGNLDRVREAYRIATRFIVVWQLAVYLALAAGAGLIAAVFSGDPEVTDAIRLFVWIMPAAYGMQGVIILTNSSLNALHRPMHALCLSVARFFVFYVPLAFLGSLHFGLPGFFVGAACGNLLMAGISRFTFGRALERLAAGEPAAPGSAAE